MTWKLSASNILWYKGTNRLEEYFVLLNGLSIPSVELALNCFWTEPIEASQEDISWLKDLLDKYQLKISALHSLTYTREDLVLFGTKKKRSELTDYIKRHMDLAKQLGAKNLVFGSPKARQRNGLPQEKADEIFHSFLSEIDGSSGSRLNIEPLPIEYCDYLNTYKQAYDFLNNHSFKNIGITFDLKALFHTNSFSTDKILKNKHFFHHAQVSNLDFSPASESDRAYHDKVINLLKDMNFQNYISLEAVYENKLEVKDKISQFQKIYKNC